jgi:protein-S-isoprenylcysteine O-methyltransferase Ste14
LPLDSIQSLSRLAVYACWFAFAGVFLLRRKPPKSVTEKRAPASWWGIGMQALAYFCVFSFRRELAPQLFPLPQGLQDALSLAAVLLAVVSAWLAVAAVRTLGKQWSVGARLAEGHQLIVAGAYSHMRHPIYTAMLGLLVATGLVTTFWPLLIAEVVLFSVGTAIRVYAEEKLLREAFGEDFDAYARYVPAILPRFHVTGAPPRA